MMSLAISLGWDPPIEIILSLLILGFILLAVSRLCGLITRRYEKFGRQTLVLGVLLGLFAYWLINRPGPRPPRLAIVPLAPATPAVQPQGLGTGIAHTAVDLLRYTLPPGVRVSPIDEVDAVIENRPVTDIPSAQAASERLGAQYLVFGDYDADGRGLVLHTRIFNAADTTITAQSIFFSPDTLSLASLHLVRALRTHIPALAALDSTLNQPLPLPPSEAFAAYCLGQAMFATRTEEGYWHAINAYQTALAIDSTYALPYLGLARVYDAWQRPDPAYETNNLLMRRKAIINANMAIRLNPRLNETYRFVADVHRSLKNREATSAMLKQAIAVDPEEPLNYVELARLIPDRYQDLGFKNEVELCEQAVKLNPWSVSLWVSLKMAYISVGNFPDAVKAGKQAVALGPMLTEAYEALGDAYIYSNDAFPAMDIYIRALEIDPLNQELYIGLAKAYTLRQDRPKAIETYRRGIEKLPNNPDLYYNLGVLYQRIGQWEEAVPWFQQAIEVGDHANAHFYMARWYEKQGDREKAVEHWTARVQLGDPDDTWTQDAARRLNILSPSAFRAIQVRH